MIPLPQKRLQKLIKDEVENMSEEEKKNSGYSEDALEAQVNAQVQNLISPWMRFFLTYDPAPTLMKVKCPVLAINGERDLQVPPKQTLQAIEEALKAGGQQGLYGKRTSRTQSLIPDCQNRIAVRICKN